jgi:hypothetical protein
VAAMLYNAIESFAAPPAILKIKPISAIDNIEADNGEV